MLTMITNMITMITKMITKMIGVAPESKLESGVTLESESGVTPQSKISSSIGNGKRRKRKE